jgi:nicotinate-nucleotide adenylyltransferase
MNLALFGGTFDPVHLGHLAVARAAAATFDLKKIYFVPASVPPHKAEQPVTAFEHRYAMLALATADDARFLPSLLEAPGYGSEPRANYTIATVRQFKKNLGKAGRTFFLIGIDAFLEIGHWREAEALLGEMEFIVVSRPGFSLGDVGAALPEKLRPPEAVSQVMHRHPATGDILLPGVTVHLLQGVAENVSATRIRQAAQKGRPLDSLVGPAVANYIRKQGLYRDTRARPPASKTGEVWQPASETGMLPAEGARRQD